MRLFLFALMLGLSSSAALAASIAFTAATANQPCVYNVPVFNPPAVQLSPALGGVPVTFSVAAGNGIIWGATQTSGRSGVVAVGGWLTPNAPGTYTITASAPGYGSCSTTVIAKGVNVVCTTTISETVPTTCNARLCPAFQISYSDSTPLNGALTVNFTVTGGGNSINSMKSDAAGNVTYMLTGWHTGPVPGANVITVAVVGGGNPTASYTITGAQCAIVCTIGNGQTALVGTNLPQPLTFRITNVADGSPIVAAMADFTVNNGGTITSPFWWANNGGMTIGGWTLGAAQGTNTLTATLRGGGNNGAPPTVQVTASGVDSLSLRK